MGLIKYVMSLMNSARLGVGAQSVGIAEAAYREAVKYAHEREQFGKAIVNYPAVYEMLTWMKVRTDAIRSLLYETARFVDVYKAYNIIAETRKLEGDERQESKNYQKLADAFTPLLKLFSSEYCNQIAYDSLQIHGGTGFMKDFPIERIYRDARITTIYEGTSQLQVVAAIRGVTSGVFLKVLRDYEARAVHPEHEPLRRELVRMTDRYEQAVKYIEDLKDNEYTDFHARRLVELAGNIVMGYLLLDDAQRDNTFERTANIFITRANTENLQHENYIRNFDPKELGEFKAVFEA
jgi:hypothetical protein